jgi:hypothetical protein
MIRKMIKIWEVERKLDKIQKDSFSEQHAQLTKLLRDLNIVLCLIPEHKEVSFLIDGVNRWIERKTILVTCFWAAIAAIFAFFSSAIALITVLSK